MNPISNAVAAGVGRARVELGQALHSPSELFNWTFFPGVSLLVMYLLRNNAVPGLAVSLGSAAIPGILGMSVVLIAALGLTTILTLERGDGTLARAKATPYGVLGYLVGKIASQAVFCLGVIALILFVAGLLFEDLTLTELTTWMQLVAVLAVGLAATLPLGAILGSLFTNPRNLNLVSLLVMGLIAVSGVFYPITALPGWLQLVGQFFPLYWLGLGLRGALLPEPAAAAEIGGSWRLFETFAVLGAWATIALFVAPIILRRMARRATGARITEAAS